MIGGGLDGYFGERGLPVGIQDCLGRFHRCALTISAGSLFQNKTLGGRKFCTGGENNGGKDREGSLQVNVVQCKPIACFTVPFDMRLNTYK